MSQVYADVIGDPVAHSKSPLIHGFWLERLGLAGRYRAVHVSPAELAGYFAGRRGDPDWRGCNVTIPHKQAVVPLVDRIDPRAAAIGAVNCVHRGADGALVGSNTDIDGVAAAVGDGGDLGDAATCVIGAGGAARAALRLLAERGAAVTILARDPAKATCVGQAFGLRDAGVALRPGSGALAGTRLLINATQLGMTGQVAMPDFILAELASLAPDALVFDMVYAPLETALLGAARARGLRTADGLAMLIGQAATAFAQLFGQPPPRAHDAALRALLTA